MPAEALRRLERELGELAGAEIELERPASLEHGDYATNVALKTAGPSRRPPREVAEELAGRASDLPLVERTEVAGPGFLNLWLADAWYEDALGELLDVGVACAAGSAITPERIQVELVSANPNGPLTVGHGRNGAYGDSVARLLAFAGHDVEREHYFNDVGRQIDLFRESVDARRRGEELPDDGYAGAYVDAIAAQSGDPVDRMEEAIRAELEAFRVPVDTYAHQSEVEQGIAAALASIDTYEAEDTIWARTTTHGDDKDRPLVSSQDGRYLYFAADVAYLRNKLDRGFDRAIYVLGADHHGYVARLKAAAGLLGFDPACVEVLIYQLVNLVEGGETKRMSKRRGDIVFLSELVGRIGVDATRWYLVSRGHDQPIDIDVDLAAEQSQKNPVYYVQYAHARIAGIRRNAADVESTAEAYGPLAKEERELVKRLVEFPAVVQDATERRAPHGLTTFAIRVADDFHRFYHEHRVVEGGEATGFRLGLCEATQAVIAQALDLIGVAAPDRM